MDPIVDNATLSVEVAIRELESLDGVDCANIYDGDDKQKFERKTLENATQAQESMPQNTKKSLVPKQQKFKACIVSSRLFVCCWPILELHKSVLMLDND